MKRLIGVMRLGPAFATGAAVALDGGKDWRVSHRDMPQQAGTVWVWWADDGDILPTQLKVSVQ